MSTARFAVAMLLGLQLASCTQLNTPPPQALDKKTSDRVTQLRKDMLLNRARALVKYEPIYQELETLLPKDHGATDDIRRYKAERNEIARHLLDCGEQSMAEKNYVQAEECLELSNQLVEAAEKQTMLDKARSIRKQQDDKRRSEQMLLAYQQAYTAGNLADAHAQLNTLLALVPDHAQALALREQLGSEIKMKMEKSLDEARNLYSQGKIAEVLAICSSLMLVDPKNEELLAMISRAEKVSKNIEKLSKTKK